MLNNAKKVFTNIFNFNSETNRILNITYNYNILLKYSYCNKFLELLQLIYNDIQSKIDYENFNIITTCIKLSNDLKYIKILFNKEKYNLEDYIAIHIINFFISPLLESGSKSLLKNNFDKIYYFYNKNFKQQIKEQSEQEQSQLEEFNNAIQIYINISDTTSLFQYISNSIVKFNNEKTTTTELLKQDTKDTIGSSNLDSDLKSLKEHLEYDINDIKQLLLFNLYVDNDIDISPNFSYIFYASFIYYRINKPLISYRLLSNLYPININNFVCNLLEINNEKLKELINNSDDELSINKEMFISNYIKHPIHDLEGIFINIEKKPEKISYTNCVENAILEFIKILFWNQTKFIIILPEKNRQTESESLQLLNKIFDDINMCIINETNIQSLYESPEYIEKIHKLFSYHEGIDYINDKYKYEMNSTIDNIYNLLFIILNFENKYKLNEYLENIIKYNPNISEIIINNLTIDIYIYNHKFYTIIFGSIHASLEIFENVDIKTLIKYDYFNLLIYYTNIISKYNEKVCEKYIYKYKNELSNNKEDYNFKYYEYIVVLMIINNPYLTINITNNFPNDIEIIYKAFEKNPEILCYLRMNVEDIITIFNTILKKISQDHPNYKDILKCIVRVSLLNKIIEYININIDHIDHDNFLNIVLRNIGKRDPDCTLIDYLFNNYYDYTRTLLKIINKDHQKHQKHPNYKYLAMCILHNYPKFIEKIPVDHPNFPEIVINSIKVKDKINSKIVDYLNTKDSNYISRLFDDINKNHSKHYNYKDLVICIISLHPELIKKISIYHKDFLEIVINSINVNDENNCEIVDHIIDINNDTYFDNLKKILLLDKLKNEYNNHPNILKLVSCILNNKKKLFKNIIRNNSDNISKSYIDL